MVVRVESNFHKQLDYFHRSPQENLSVKVVSEAPHDRGYASNRHQGVLVRAAKKDGTHSIRH